MRIGVDLGGTKIEVIALGESDRVLEPPVRVPTPRDDYALTVRAIVGLVEALESRLGASGTVGMGIPGAISRRSGLVKNANSVWLNGKPLDRDLEVALGRPVRIANDANCFALSEATDGAARGADVVFGVILGTGVGGGLVVRGREIEGASSIAGEWGHNPLPWPADEERPGPPCYCGKHGCIETFLSGPALARDHGGGKTAHEVAALASASDPAATAALDRYVDRLARALATVIDVVDPDVVVLGGGMSNVDALIREVPSRWGRWVFSDAVDTRLVRAEHGDSSGVRGAARLWPLSS
ncbi:MAG: ROK family protein [Deltaproteobacteria bacterium]|nr:ROK family protein [Deltaproteobacteria bacterium]